MRIALLITPFTDQNIQRAAQIGVTDIVSVYPGLDLNYLLELRKRVESFGLRLSAVERLLPTLKFIHNLPGRDQQIEDFKTLIRNMGKAGVSTLCYSWMPADDWQRTDLEAAERGGAKVTAFEQDKPSSVPTDTGYRKESKDSTSAERLPSRQLPSSRALRRTQGRRDRLAREGLRPLRPPLRPRPARRFLGDQSQGQLHLQGPPQARCGQVQGHSARRYHRAQRLQEQKGVPDLHASLTGRGSDQRQDREDGVPDEQPRLGSQFGRRSLPGSLGHRGLLQGNQADPQARRIYRIQ